VHSRCLVPIAQRGRNELTNPELAAHIALVDLFLVIDSR